MHHRSHSFISALLFFRRRGSQFVPGFTVLSVYRLPAIVDRPCQSRALHLCLVAQPPNPATLQRRTRLLYCNCTYIQYIQWIQYIQYIQYIHTIHIIHTNSLTAKPLARHCLLILPVVRANQTRVVQLVQPELLSYQSHLI